MSGTKCAALFVIVHLTSEWKCVIILLKNEFELEWGE